MKVNTRTAKMIMTACMVAPALAVGARMAKSYME